MDQLQTSLITLKSMSSTLEEQHSGVGNLDGMEEGEEGIKGIESDLRGKAIELMECQSKLESAQDQLKATQKQLTSTQAKLESARDQLKATQKQLTSTQAELEITKADWQSVQVRYSSLQSDYESLLQSCQSTRQEGQQTISNELDQPNVVPQPDTQQPTSFLALDSVTDEISQEDKDMEELALSGMEELRLEVPTGFFQIPEYTSPYDSPHIPLAVESQLWEGILNGGMLKNSSTLTS